MELQEEETRGKIQGGDVELLKVVVLLLTMHIYYFLL